MIAWPDDVNQRVLRATTWQTPTSVIADETRCGARKVRLSNALQPTTLSVQMRMTLEEKELFLDWFKNECRYGAYAFAFPKVDDDSGENAVYRFVAGSSVSFSNDSGLFLTVSMEWEEAEGEA